MGLSSRGFAVAVTAFVLVALAVVGFYVVSAATQGRASRAVSAPFGDPASGRTAITEYGCSSCHRIAGIRRPGGRVGPDLTDLPQRRFVAGDLPNTPENLVRWIMAPQTIRPNTAMPNLGVSRPDAEDIAAYLYMSGERR